MARDPALWRRITKEFGEAKLSPVFTEKTQKKLPELQRLAAERDPTYQAEPLTTFFYMEMDSAADLPKAAALLAQSPAIRSVDIETPGPDPLVNSANDPRAISQGYLDAAPDGIDARYAWTITGGDGAAQRLIDVEQGWTFNHEDLVNHGITLLNGVIVNGSRAHGTAVLGEVCAVDNTLGCVGIAPNLASVFTASRNPSLADSIVDVLPSLEFGDVMLLETQDAVAGSIPPRYGPSEIVEATWEAIRLATALGVVVVEAGGNGTNNGGTPAVDLDLFTDMGGNRILWRDAANPDFKDSGAIIVAAASSAAPHTRLAYSSFGARIDCFGWGENVETCSSDPAGATALYRSNFSGTSSASPIVAGAALCVQGVCQTAHGFRLSPRQVRAVLSDPLLNTLPSATETTAMGVLPNLRSIIDNTLGIVPDVYIRDNVGDLGEPHAGAISSSPDIILRPFAVADAQASFGAGSGTENDNSLGFEAEAGQDNFIYVRALNQGGAPASNVEAQIFWSPPATLVTPDLWTTIGTAVIPNIPMGEVLTCSDALVWPAGAIPAQGHYCLVGLLGTAGDPAPNPADFLNFDNFRTFIRQNNNVTWRNFNVVDNLPDNPEAMIVLPWLLPGAPDRAAMFALEMNFKLPRKADVLLDFPLSFLRVFDGQLKIEEVDAKSGRGLARLPARGRLLFGPRQVPAKARFPMKLLVRTNTRDDNNVFRIDARQLFEGKEEVGRLTWLLDPKVRQRLERAKADMRGAVAARASELVDA